MASSTVPDCLVLKIEEHDIEENDKLVSTLYVLYDKMEHHYVIRGQALCSSNKPLDPFSFICEDADDLASFISFVICKENLWTYVLYNYDNLPDDSNDITFGFLKDCDSQTYEIAGYNKLFYSKKQLMRNLRMLRKVFNYY